MYDLDAQKLSLHPYRVTAWLDGKVTYPMTAEISPTNRCNQNCSFCAFDYRRSTETLNQQELHRLSCGIAQLRNGRTLSVHFGGEGEPTLNPHLGSAMRRLAADGVRIGMTTNGMDLNTQYLMRYMTWIRFSINAIVHEIYAKLHGVKKECLDDVLEALKACVAVKKAENLKTTIGVQCLWFPENEQQIDLLASAVRDLGVDYFAVKPYSQHPESTRRCLVDYSQNLETMERRLWKLKTDTFCPHVRMQALSDTREKKDYEHCPAAAFFAFVASDGGVYPCAQFVGNHDYCFGNVRLQTWEEVITSSRRKHVLEGLRYEHDVATCRQPCRLNAANRYLNRVIATEGHDLFL